MILRMIKKVLALLRRAQRNPNMRVDRPNDLYYTHDDVGKSDGPHMSFRIK